MTTGGIAAPQRAPAPRQARTMPKGRSGSAMQRQENRAAYLFLTPQRRYGQVSEIADAAVFLCSAESDYVNGVTLNVDGGFGSAGLQYPLPG